MNIKNYSIDETIVGFSDIKCLCLISVFFFDENPSQSKTSGCFRLDFSESAESSLKQKAHNHEKKPKNKGFNLVTYLEQSSRKSDIISDFFLLDEDDGTNYLLCDVIRSVGTIFVILGGKLVDCKAMK